MNFLLPLIAHLLGDFMFQGSTLADKKKTSLKHYFVHCLVYSGFILLSLIWFGPFLHAFYAALIIIVSHAVIDFVRSLLTKRLTGQRDDKKSSEFVIFIGDQTLHIIVIIFSAHFLNETSALGNNVLNSLLQHMPKVQLYNLLVIVLLYLLCLSPTAIFIKKVFILFSFQNEEGLRTKDELLKSGYLIGVLERVIILTLGLNGELGAIGLVIAAKSIARFKMLEDKVFAEKYLVGTLMSLAIALLYIMIGKAVMIK